MILRLFTTILLAIGMAIALTHHSIANTKYSASKTNHAAAYLSARQAQKERDWLNASKYWGIVLKETPMESEIPHILSRAALTSLAAGEYETAIEYAQKNADEHKDALTVFDTMILSANAVNQGDMKRFNKLLDSIDDEAFQQLVVPTIKNYMEKADGSEKIRYATALMDLAKLFLSEGREDSTLLFARLSAFLDPASGEINALLGDSLFSSADYDQAIIHYKRVTGDIEAYTRSRLLAARALRHLDRNDEAIKMLKDLSKETESADVLYELADYYRLDKDYKQAEKGYSYLISSFGEGDIPQRYAYAYYLRGIAKERNGHWDDAVKDFQKALDVFPENADILNYLGYGWIDRGENIEEAENMIRKALEIKPNDGYITDSLGWALYKKGEYEEAVKYLERAVELEPYDPIINDHLGDAYWEANRKQEARYQWKRALNYYTDDTPPELSLATIEQKLEQGLDQKK